MATVTQNLKSKTNQATVVAAAALSILPVFGIVVDPGVSAGIMALVGLLMRQLTNGSLAEK
jgi:uncharacterized membrane protein